MGVGSQSDTGTPERQADGLLRLSWSSAEGPGGTPGWGHVCTWDGEHVDDQTWELIAHEGQRGPQALDLLLQTLPCAPAWQRAKAAALAHSQQALDELLARTAADYAGWAGAPLTSPWLDRQS